MILSHPLGNQFVRHLAVGLERRDQLQRLYTSVAVRTDQPLSGWLPQRARSELLRRQFPLPHKKIRSNPWREMARQICLKTNWRGPLRHETGWASVDRVYREIDQFTASYLPKEVACGALHAVYAYEDASVHTFREAQKLGLRRVYDLTIGHYRAAQRILNEEREMNPEFAGSIEGLLDSAEKLARKDEELALADTVVACSDFVRQTLLEAGCPQEKILVVQYGSPDAVVEKSWQPEDMRRPLRVLFVGRVGQRKGVGYLLQAVKKLDRADIELHVLGEIIGEPATLWPYAKWFAYQPPRPHAAVLEFMKSCDVLVLPTLFEGQALVILEAMKMGLPVVTTPNSGAENLIENGKEGFLVPIRSVEAIEEKLAWFASNRAAVEGMGRAACQRASQCTWENYTEALCQNLSVPHPGNN